MGATNSRIVRESLQIPIFMVVFLPSYGLLHSLFARRFHVYSTFDHISFKVGRLPLTSGVLDTEANVPPLAGLYDADWEQCYTGFGTPDHKRVLLLLEHTDMPPN